ncbi:hypothetical protein BpHYR1_034332 [Brachionus plicatilis]|uniref:Uncharacterized protein n=1 Tax=Brachionus plicatilis TaxID=10195 RepID=A0A3M7RLC6_BRAPC|nr:hypothetical protein BpHYR1_034332 [Brachionus plicatilis]
MLEKRQHDATCLKSSPSPNFLIFFSVSKVQSLCYQSPKQCPTDPYKQRCFQKMSSLVFGRLELTYKYLKVNYVRMIEIIIFDSNLIRDQFGASKKHCIIIEDKFRLLLQLKKIYSKTFKENYQLINTQKWNLTLKFNASLKNIASFYLLI